MVILANSNPMSYSYFATVQTACQIKQLKAEVTRDCCECCDCAYIEMAFVKLNGKPHQTDKTSFLFSKVLASDTFTFKLLKNDVIVQDVNATIGTVFTGLPNALYLGYLIDWYKVKALHGYGYYTVQATHTSTGLTVVWDSHIYNVVEYNDCFANGTVKLETYQTGTLKNFTYNNWYQSIRVEGFFGFPTPEYETENYQNSERKITQIRDKVILTYKLITKVLPSTISNMITYNQVLANKIVISDYNSINNEVFLQKQIAFKSYENVIHARRSQSHVLIFTDRFDNLIKI